MDYQLDLGKLRQKRNERIIEMLKSGFTHRQIMLEIGICESTIFKLKKQNGMVSSLGRPPKKVGE